MASVFGSFEQFDPAFEEWANYVKRVEQYFEANGLVGEDKAAKDVRPFICYWTRSIQATQESRGTREAE